MHVIQNRTQCSHQSCKATGSCSITIVVPGNCNSSVYVAGEIEEKTKLPSSSIICVYTVSDCDERSTGTLCNASNATPLRVTKPINCSASLRPIPRSTWIEMLKSSAV